MPSEVSVRPAMVRMPWVRTRRSRSCPDADLYLSVYCLMECIDEASSGRNSMLAWGISAGLLRPLMMTVDDGDSEAMRQAMA